MNSFYGGKRGFGFILRGNTVAEDNLFHNEEEILTAIEEQRLSYGEYVLLSSPDEDNLDKLGNLYRIVENGIEKVAQISGPRGPQGIQGAPGEAGSQGEPGVGVVYREIEDPDLTPSLYSVITFEKAEGMSALEVDETALVVDAFYEEDGELKQKYQMAGPYSKSTFAGWDWPNAEKRAFLNKVAAYDIKACLEKAQHEDPFVAVYKGGLLPPAIFVHNTLVKFKGEKLKMSGDRPVVKDGSLVVEKSEANVVLPNGFYIITSHGAVVLYQWNSTFQMKDGAGRTYSNQTPNLFWLFSIDASSNGSQDYFYNPVFLYGRYENDRNDLLLLPQMSNSYIDTYAVTFPWTVESSSTYDYLNTPLQNPYPGIIWNDNTAALTAKIYAPGFSSAQNAASKCNYPGFRWGEDFFHEFGKQWTKILKISDE